MDYVTCSDLLGVDEAMGATLFSISYDRTVFCAQLAGPFSSPALSIDVRTRKHPMDFVEWTIS